MALRLFGQFSLSGRVLASLATLLAAGSVVPTALAKQLPLSPAQVKQLDIQCAELQAATQRVVSTLPATIIAPVNSRIAISAPFAGTVVSVSALPGQAVRQGQPLATLASRDLLDAVVKLKQAEADLELLQANARRQLTLVKKNLAAPIKGEEAVTQVNRMQAVVNETKRLLSIGNIVINADRTYTLTAPKAGRVVEMRASPGAALQAMDAAAVIDTSRDLWVQAQLPAQLIGTVVVGDKIQMPNGSVGKVISVGISVDPLTRSTTLLAEIPENAGFITGQTTTVAISKPVRAGLEAPIDAISWIAGKPYVFLRTAAGFTPTPVTIIGQTATSVTFEAQLRQGQKVATSGLAQLEKMMGGEP